MADGAEPAAARRVEPTLDSLHVELLRTILQRVPAPEAFRLAVVSRAWGAMVAQPALWTSSVQLSSDAPGDWTCLSVETAVARLAALPGLTTLAVDVTCSAAESSRFLRSRAHLVRRLRVSFLRAFVCAALQAPPSFAAFLDDFSANATVSQLCLVGAPMHHDAPMFGLVDAAARRGQPLHALRLDACSLPRLSAGPAHAQLLRAERALSTLEVCGNYQQLRVTSGLCSAVRASRLTRLTLRAVGLFESQLGAGLDLLHALCGHATVAHLCLASNAAPEQGRHSLGVALAALAAPPRATAAPALTSLDISDCSLRDEAFDPLLDALPGYLHVLNCASNALSQRAVARLAEAVQNHRALRNLEGRGFAAA